MVEVLTTEQLNRLVQHKYQSEGKSILEVPMNRFWVWLVEKLPLWIAPNTLTLAGLACNVTTCLLIMYYSPDAKSPIPALPLVLAAIGLFVYQALDAVDGKQARRTQSSSPLGELFDHGCDCVSSVVVMLAAGVTMGLGTEPWWLLFEFWSSLFLFYASHWQTYVSGTLRFNRVDVTEAQFLIIATYLAVALSGIELFDNIVPFLGLKVKHFAVLLGAIPAAVSLINFAHVIFVTGGLGKNGSTVANTSVLFPVFPIGICLLISYICARMEPEILDSNIVIFCLMHGMVAAKATNRLVIAHMTKSELQLADWALLGPLSCIINSYIGQPVSSKFMLYFALAYVCVDFLKFSANVVNQICDYLSIECFRLTGPYVPPPIIERRLQSRTLSAMTRAGAVGGTRGRPQGRYGVGGQAGRGYSPVQDSDSSRPSTSNSMDMSSPIKPRNYTPQVSGSQDVEFVSVKEVISEKSSESDIIPSGGGVRRRDNSGKNEKKTTYNTRYVQNNNTVK